MTIEEARQKSIDLDHLRILFSDEKWLSVTNKSVRDFFKADGYIEGYEAGYDRVMAMSQGQII